MTGFRNSPVLLFDIGLASSRAELLSEFQRFRLAP